MMLQRSKKKAAPLTPLKNIADYCLLIIVLGDTNGDVGLIVGAGS